MLTFGKAGITNHTPYTYVWALSQEILGENFRALMQSVSDTRN